MLGEVQFVTEYQQKGFIAKKVKQRMRNIYKARRNILKSYLKDIE